MDSSRTDEDQPQPLPAQEESLGEWVEAALEVPNGTQLGRLLHQSQPEDAAWRRIQAAERRLRELTNGAA